MFPAILLSCCSSIPAKFVKLDEISRVHLIDLVLSRDGVELERKDVAWTSGDMDSRNFKGGASPIVQSPGSSSDGSLPGGVLRRENGTMVIS